MLLMDIITRVAFRKPNLCNLPAIQLLRCNIHKSSITLLDKKWRAKNRLTGNPNAFGPLTNMPDYSFQDGRPTPYGIRQMIRIDKQRNYLTRIQKLTGEIDYAVERHAKLQEQKEIEKQTIIGNKLKPKGHLP